MKLYFGRAQYKKRNLPLITSVCDPSEEINEVIDKLRDFSKAHVDDPDYPDATYYISCWEADSWDEKNSTPEVPVKVWQRPLEDFIS